MLGIVMLRIVFQAQSFVTWTVPSNSALIRCGGLACPTCRTTKTRPWRPSCNTRTTTIIYDTHLSYDYLNHHRKTMSSCCLLQPFVPPFPLTPVGLPPASPPPVLFSLSSLLCVSSLCPPLPYYKAANFPLTLFDKRSSLCHHASHHHGSKEHREI